MSETVTVTEAARELIVRLKARYGSLMFMQSGGCCDGSAPMCLHEGELLLGPNDLLHWRNCRLSLLYRSRAVRALAQATVPD